MSDKSPTHLAKSFIAQAHSVPKMAHKGRYVFSWGGRAGEFWYFFPKKVLALPCVLIKKLLTPHFRVTDKSATLPSLQHGMFHAVETSERFACERKVFEYEYISILNVCVLKQRK